MKKVFGLNLISKAGKYMHLSNYINEDNTLSKTSLVLLKSF